MPGDEKDAILYPASAPFNEGTLKVDQYVLHYQEYGNKDGIPIVFLHGGPGAGCAPYYHQFFDPKAFRIITYDQRGAPNSEPPGEIKDNSPAQLVEDNEKLRQQLGIDKWHVFGGSWGSTLALLYAEKYPEHTSSLTLRGVFMMREQELDWYLNRQGTFFPEVYKEFIDFLPEAERKDVLESYYQRLVNPDPAVHLPAAAAWTRFENGCAFLEVPPDEIRNDDPVKALPFARIEAHFMRNHMPDDSIMLNIGKIKDIPTSIVQGRHDNVCPPQSAFDLAAKLGNCSLEFVQSGHSCSMPETMKALVAATDRIRDTGSPVLKKTPAPAAAARLETALPLINLQGNSDMPKAPENQILYPASKPNQEGDLQLDALHKLHYEEFGNPAGVPIVYLHGGPGAGSGPHFHQFFDPDYFRIIIYDQRGAGKSTPVAEIRDNTPDLLVDDLERLKDHLGIDKWHVYGGSWGSTLALLYAEEHPESVETLTLRGIFLMRQKDIQMFYDAAELFRPEELRRLKEFLPEAERADFIESFHKRLTSPDPAVNIPAAQAWSYFENVCCFKNPPPEAELHDPDADALNISRIESHFFRDCLLDPDDRILKNIGTVRHIPTHIVQGNWDLVCPPAIAFDLKRAFPEAVLQLTDAGHGATEPENMKALVAATNRIRDTGTPVPAVTAPPPANSNVPDKQNTAAPPAKKAASAFKPPKP